MCYRHGHDLEAKFVARRISTAVDSALDLKIDYDWSHICALDMKIRLQIRLRHCKIDRYSPETA
ncbi:hypothetical protein B0H17DRAFT_1210229 [Mycena rosella]|uniref:Uncharacterized protein n=1 Tax=Mycena rosella TaxID=1033263 RepID=A0AAD7G7P4_MYCRO|nr:hypothetical protein B0H17DRAFT_1210229 [Mycena rosella]